MLSIRSSRIFAALFAIAAIVACDGPKGRATYVNTLLSYSVFAITGAPVNAPSALSFLAGPTTADATFAFDVAFDIDPSGTTRLYPVRSLASGLSSAGKRIGVQQVAGSFEALREAPATGYDTAGAKVVVPGAVFAFEIQDVTTCLYSLGGTNLYSKLIVDSIQLANRRVFVRTVSDANCGFRELMPDSIPER